MKNQEIKKQKRNTLHFILTHATSNLLIFQMFIQIWSPIFLTFLIRHLYFLPLTLQPASREIKNNLASLGEEGRTRSRMIHTGQVTGCQITYRFTIHVPVQFTTHRCFPRFLRLRRRPAWDIFRVNRSVCCGFILNSREAVDLAYIPNTLVVHIKLSTIMVSQKQCH